MYVRCPCLNSDRREKEGREERMREKSEDCNINAAVCETPILSYFIMHQCFFSLFQVSIYGMIQCFMYYDGWLGMCDVFVNLHFSLSFHRASEWKVPTTFIYGFQDWMNYEGAKEARKHMKVPCEILRVPQAGHFVFIDNPSGFHSAVFYACRRFLRPDPDSESLPEGLTSA